MNKYRIVARYTASDDPYYIVQQKRWYGWGCPSRQYSWVLTNYIGESYESFSTFEAAEAALNEYLKEIKNAKRKSEIIKVYEEPSS